MRTRFPPIEPYRTGFLPVSKEHTIYFEESGNPNGNPIVFVHGGPGSGTEGSHRTFFNPAIYRIILFDQRGCGKSRPYSSLQDNTTWHLVADMEKLREHLDIGRWVVFGGSWGSTLSLAYAETHPNRVKGLILRGIFLGRKQEMQWFYQFGAHHIFPDEFEKYLAPIPVSERGDLIRAYHHRLTSADGATRQKAAKAWSTWEGATLRLLFDPEYFATFTEDQRADAIARIECHYFLNHCFFETDNWLIENVHKIRHIPGVIVHGRYDMICPFENAWDLHKAWPEAQFEIVKDAGHASSEPGILEALLKATESFQSLD